MLKLLEIELRKLTPYRFFWLAAAAYILMMPGLFISLYRFNINVKGATIDFNFYNFPDVWHNCTFIAGWFNILLYFFVLQVVTNEYQFRTIRQNIIDGLSRWQYLAAKALLLLFFAVCSTLLVALIALLCGLFLSEAPNQAQMWQKTEYLGYYFLQLLGYLSFALLVGTLVRKQATSIIVFIGYTLVLENIIRYRFFADNIGPYLPLQVLGALMPNPLPYYFGMGEPPVVATEMITLSVVYILLFLGLSGWLIRQRDL